MTMTMTFAEITNRNLPVDAEIERLLEHWRYDIEKRAVPAAIIDADGKKCAKADMLSFLSALCDRGAVINLESYQSATASTTRSDQLVVSKANRHGKLKSIVFNQETLGASVRIVDANVITTDEDGEQDVGADRNFTVVTPDGEFYAGMPTMDFVPNRKENDFIAGVLNDDGTIMFDRFVSEQRRYSFFGRPYLTAKLLIERLKDEATFCRAEMARIVQAGVTVPASSYVPVAKGATVPKTIRTIEVDIQDVDAAFSGSYAAYSTDLAGWEAARKRKNAITYVIVPKLVLHTRATELAMMKYDGVNPVTGDVVMTVPKWAAVTVDNALKIKRTVWHALKRADNGPTLLWRVKDKTIQVNPNAQL